MPQPTTYKRIQYAIPQVLKNRAIELIDSEHKNDSQCLGELVQKGLEKYNKLGKIPDCYVSWARINKPSNRTTCFILYASTMEAIKNDRKLGRLLSKRIIHLLALALFEPENLP